MIFKEHMNKVFNNSKSDITFSPAKHVQVTLKKSVNDSFNKLDDETLKVLRKDVGGKPSSFSMLETSNKISVVFIKGSNSDKKDHK